MKRLSLFLMAGVLFWACTEAPTAPEPAESVALFGTEPSPFYPSATNELDAAVHKLEGVEDRISQFLVMPPDPWKPSDVHPVAGKLGAMENELTALDSKIKAVLAMPPDPYAPTAFRTVVVAVYDAAGNVLNEAINAKLGFEPTPFYPDVEPAFVAVEGAAAAIQATVVASGHCPAAGTGTPGCIPLPGF
jgi:hypothetical protein